MLQSAFVDGLAQRPTDLLRLVVVPAFAWAAWQDIQVRRVPNRLWPPLALLGIALLLLDGWHFYQLGGPRWQLFLVGTAISVLIVVPLTYLFWLLGGFGGADVKALATLALLLPTFPTFYVGERVLPLVEPHANAFALTVLTNAVVVGLLYPVSLGLRNAVRGDYSKWMFLGRRADWDELPRVHGRLLETPEGFSRDGLDVDALRMYLRWRGLDLADLRARADELRDPATLPAEPNPPTDGAIDRGGDVATDGGHVDDGRDEDWADGGSDDSGSPDDGSRSDDGRADGGHTEGRVDGDAAEAVDEDASEPVGDEAADETIGDDEADGDETAADETASETAGAAGEGDEPAAGEHDDPWGAAAFLHDIDRSAYGTSPETLRGGLDVVAERDAVWYSPGVPFIVPVFAGLLVALTYGDLLFGLMQWLGLV